MDILVIGSGGREHTIVRKLRESPRVNKLYCAPGNGGISADAQCCNVDAMDKKGMLALAREKSVDMVFVAPDDPLGAGMVDFLEAGGFTCFGPNKKAAEIESSKVFSKNLMKKYGIPTAGYEVFTSPSEALDYIRSQGKYPAVIKADGLAVGKGVTLAQNEQEAAEALHSLMEERKFGSSGDRVVVEEFLTGPEVTVLAFTDGHVMCPMVSSMDHKRAYDNDVGPNTGGMGTISPSPFYTDEIAKVCMDTIFLPTMNAMNAEGRKFKGCLYFGLMLTPDGPKVIEYNSRFGDPETQVVLPRLKTDLVDIIEAVANEKLSEIDVKWSDEACACVIIASGGYPGSYEKGKLISGLDKNGQLDGATVIHAGTKLEDGKFYTSGGRVLGITAKGADLREALDRAYKSTEKVSFDGAFYRKDIGSRCFPS
ncbi:MAG: phosphoribosylamine--glycine ligase [Acutalibacter sp.]|jgi:phosphoribosylamine--glycine ligase|uniref:phosphoribosylamine--glycine ligase n=1 Tax=Acutalibacter sp. TaxID=1918636 RepID=UPI00216E39C1|nr:phosphoribosylamine--glycine ligase [Acutalibacter sp.]MCI9224808.1 phosphoribosylamine--glycine ligase [Acutalibacter sp.]